MKHSMRLLAALTLLLTAQPAPAQSLSGEALVIGRSGQRTLQLSPIEISVHGFCGHDVYL